MPGTAAALLLGLCALALCGQLARAQITATNTPPEDLDGSGDDDDGFSGSGAGAVAVAERPLLDLSLASRRMKGLATTSTAAPDKPENSSREASGEGFAPVPARRPEEEPPPERPPSSPAATLPSTPRPPPTLGATGAPPGAPQTPSPGDEGSSASGQAERGSGQHPVEESSGSGSEDFTFLAPGEPGLSLETSPTEGGAGRGTAGASRGLLDRKEVLGGVIAGGLVGLLFAVLLVGFMLYRMKKKDEGSYSLEEPKQANGAYQKPQRQEEFYA